MLIKTGCDIVEIKRFQDVDLQSLKKIFHENELKNSKPETLAGIFAAKESCKKVFNLNWLDIEVKKKRNGKPVLILNDEKINDKIIDYDLSVSHDGDYAIAVVVFMIK